MRRFSFAIIVGALLAVWIAWSNAARTKRVDSTNAVESITQRRAAANAMLLKACTNQVPGVNRVTDIFVDDSAHLASQWKGRATVEYQNSIGGVDRTNLFFIFTTAYGHLDCMLDPEWINRLQREQLQRNLAAASK